MCSGKVEMSPFVPRKPNLFKVLNGMENNNGNGAIHDEHRRIRAFREVIRKVVDKHVTQAIASRQVGCNGMTNKAISKKIP